MKHEDRDLLMKDLYKKDHFWTIQDAKDGNVISYDDGWTCIFKCIHGIWYSSYCFITSDGKFYTGYERHAVDSTINGNAHPATKEQCNILFQKNKRSRLQMESRNKNFVSGGIIMKLWIARDKDRSLFLYNDKPKIIEKYPFMFLGSYIVKLNKDKYPEVTWENSPQELILKSNEG